MRLTRVKRKTEKTYTVERILQRRRGAEGFEFLVKWLNYESDQNTWEPEASFATREPIEIFEAALKAGTVPPEGVSVLTPEQIAKASGSTPVKAGTNGTNTPNTPNTPASESKEGTPNSKRRLRKPYQGPLREAVTRSGKKANIVYSDVKRRKRGEQDEEESRSGSQETSDTPSLVSSMRSSGEEEKHAPAEKNIPTEENVAAAAAPKLTVEAPTEQAILERESADKASPELGEEDEEDEGRPVLERMVADKEQGQKQNPKRFLEVDSKKKVVAVMSDIESEEEMSAEKKEEQKAEVKPKEEDADDANLPTLAVETSDDRPGSTVSSLTPASTVGNGIDVNPPPLPEPGPPFNWPAYCAEQNALIAPLNAFWQREGKIRNYFYGQLGNLLIAPDPLNEGSWGCVGQVASVYGPWVAIWLFDTDKDRRTWYLADDSRLKYLEWGFDNNDLAEPARRKSTMRYSTYITKHVFIEGENAKYKRVPREAFHQLAFSARPTSNHFEPGMKLESFDPNFAAGEIFVTTVVASSHEGLVKISCDGYRKTRDVHFADPCLLPCGFAEKEGIRCVLPLPDSNTKRSKRTLDAIVAGCSTSLAAAPLASPTPSVSSSSAFPPLSVYPKVEEGLQPRRKRTKPSAPKRLNGSELSMVTAPSSILDQLPPAYEIDGPVPVVDGPQMIYETHCLLNCTPRETQMMVYVSEDCYLGPHIVRGAFSGHSCFGPSHYTILWTDICQTVVRNAQSIAHVLQAIPLVQSMDFSVLSITYFDGKKVCMRFIRVPLSEEDFWYLLNELVTELRMCKNIFQKEDPRRDQSARPMQPQCQSCHDAVLRGEMGQNSPQVLKGIIQDPNRFLADGVNLASLTSSEVQQFLLMAKIPHVCRLALAENMITGQGLMEMNLTKLKALRWPHDAAIKLLEIVEHIRRRWAAYEERMANGGLPSSSASSRAVYQRPPPGPAALNVRRALGPS